MAKKTILQPSRNSVVLDATNCSIGRLATQVAKILLGKNKPSYEYHKDSGDFVVIENIQHVRFTGKKFQTKVYHNYSGYPGGLKTTSLKKIFNENPSKILELAVLRMLPETRHRNNIMKRLIINDSKK